jgi:hypothetical protein
MHCLRRAISRGCSGSTAVTAATAKRCRGAVGVGSERSIRRRRETDVGLKDARLEERSPFPIDLDGQGGVDFRRGVAIGGGACLLGRAKCPHG